MLDSSNRFLISFVAGGLSFAVAIAFAVSASCSRPATDPREFEKLSDNVSAATDVKAGLEPGRSSGELEALHVAFDPAKLLWYDGTPVGESLSPNRLKAMRTISASSTLKTAGGRDYPVQHTGDQNLATAWCEGVNGPGVGQFIRVRFAENQVPAGMSIVPGYAKSPKVWARNPRVRTLRVRFLASEEAIAEARAEGEPEPTREFVARLLERDGQIPHAKAQFVDFRPPFTQDMSILNFDGVELSILDMESVSKNEQATAMQSGAGSDSFEDLCISELRFYEW